MAAEKQFETRIKRYLDSKGCWYVKFFANRNTKVGVPDILACCGGVFVGIEVKGPCGRPSELQLYNCRRINKAGGVAAVVWPDDFDQLKSIIDTLCAGGGMQSVAHLVFADQYLHAVPAQV